MRSVQSITGPRVLHVGAVLSLLALAGCGSPDSAQLLSRAADAAEEGRYRAAAIDLRTAVANEPDNAEARFRLGLMALQLGDPATAEKELRRARELGYEEASLLEPTAEALIELSRARQALAELALVAPATANSEALSGRAHEQLDEQDYALRAYQRSLALDGDNEDALLGKARFASAKGDREAAEEALERARRAHGDSLDVALDLGRFLLLTQRPEEGEAVLANAFASAQAFQSPVKRGDVLVSLAEAQLAQSKLDAAAETARTLLTVRPDDILATYIDARIAYARDDLAL
ncbi:MAG: tetratricopeptide repeat protein, partial [Pseudomonadota bacterium]